MAERSKFFFPVWRKGRVIGWRVFYLGSEGSGRFLFIPRPPSWEDVKYYMKLAKIREEISDLQKQMSDIWRTRFEIQAMVRKSDDALDEIKAILRSARARKNAKLPRKKRGKAPKTLLLERGLDYVMRVYPNITVGTLCDILDADGHITDDEEGYEVEITRDGDTIVIRDLQEDPKVRTATIKISSLRQYLSECKT